MRHATGSQLSDLMMSGLFERIVEHTSAVIYVKDLSFRYVFVNHQFENLFDVHVNEIRGRDDFEIFPADLASVFRHNDERVAKTGESVRCEEYAPHGDGIHTYVSIKFPILDDFGKIFAVAGISTDITESIQVHKRLDSLNQEFQIILNSVGDGICRLDSDGNLTFLNPAGERMLGYSKDELHGQCRSTFIVNRRRRSEPCAIDQVLSGDIDRGVSDGAFRHKNGSLIPVELVVSAQRQDDQTVGSVIAFRDVTDRVERLRTEHEMMAARAVQMALYPKHDPVLEGFEIAGVTHAASLTSGDYFDFIKTPDGSLVVTVGDVSGHGLGPALEMVETRASFRTVLNYESDLGVALSRLNRVLSNDLPEGMFVTLFALKLDPMRRSMTYTSAGHQANILFHSDQVSRLESTGTVLGVSEDYSFETLADVQLHSGDLIVLATDGIMEQEGPPDEQGNTELFGWNRTMDSVRKHRHLPAREILNLLCKDVREFAQNSPQKDDVTAVIIKVQ